MSDTVTRIWNGPFDAHVADGGRLVTVTPGDPIKVTPTQAKENPGWFQPIPTKTAVRPVESVERVVA